MTENEAIEVISSAIEQSTQIIVELTNIKNEAEREGRIGEYYANLDNCIKEIDACEVATKALKEVQQYRAIGTLEECREAVEKQTAKNPINNDRRTCPSCGTYNEVIKKRRNTVVCDTVYCWHCGQAIECRRDTDFE